MKKVAVLHERSLMRLELRTPALTFKNTQAEEILGDPHTGVSNPEERNISDVVGPAALLFNCEGCKDGL